MSNLALKGKLGLLLFNDILKIYEGKDKNEVLNILNSITKKDNNWVLFQLDNILDCNELNIVKGSDLLCKDYNEIESSTELLNVIDSIIKIETSKGVIIIGKEEKLKEFTEKLLDRFNLKNIIWIVV
ncbi:hypothetical protein [Methanocaldococcus sp.]